jgi:hypothetical protein
VGIAFLNLGWVLIIDKKSHRTWLSAGITGPWPVDITTMLMVGRNMTVQVRNNKALGKQTTEDRTYTSRYAAMTKQDWKGF